MFITRGKEGKTYSVPKPQERVWSTICGDDGAAGNALDQFPPSLTQHTCAVMEAAELTVVYVLYGRKLQHGPFGAAALQVMAQVATP